ncbi:hypothetical protein IGI04_007364, partial [Brassica rapa subsp. trilocularis]
ILFYETALRKKESRHPTKARNRSLHNDRTSVPLGRYVATELSQAWSLRSDRALVSLGRNVATELEPKLGRYVATERSSRSRPSSAKLGRYVATELEPKFGRCVAIKLFRTSIRHQPMHSRRNFECYLLKTIASSVNVFRHSNSSIKLRGFETAERSFFIKRNRSKRVESEDGPKGPKTRLEAHPTIS